MASLSAAKWRRRTPCSSQYELGPRLRSSCLLDLPRCKHSRGTGVFQRDHPPPGTTSGVNIVMLTVVPREIFSLGTFCVAPNCLNAFITRRRNQHGSDGPL